MLRSLASTPQLRKLMLYLAELRLPMSDDGFWKKSNRAAIASSTRVETKAYFWIGAGEEARRFFPALHLSECLSRTSKASTAAESFDDELL